MPIKTGNLREIDENQTDNLSKELLAAVLKSAQELVTGSGWLASVNTLLAELGRITQVSRVWIFQTLDLQDDYILQDYVFEWASENNNIQIGLPHFNHFKSNIDTPEYAALIESRKRGEYQNLIVKEVPDSWLKSYLENQNILSMLTIPIIVDNQWWGTLGLDDCAREVKWSDTEISLLRTASFFISSAVIRDNLAAKRSQLSALKQNSACSTWELDIRRGHLWCTSEIFFPAAAAVRNIHFTIQEWLRKIHPDFRRDFFRLARQFLNGQSSQFRCDLKLLKNDGSYGWVEVSINSAPGDSSQNSMLAGILWDITERKEAEVRLTLEATTDPLTGVMNRRKFDQMITAHLSALKQHQQIFSLAMIDIDFFKKINDSYGHTIGDKVLCHFIKVCKGSLRNEDYISRIGGEEFALLLPHTSEKEAVTICKRIRALIEQTPYQSNDTSIEYSISIGCTTVRDANLQAIQVLEQADIALYQAKQAGRNRVVVK